MGIDAAFDPCGSAQVAEFVRSLGMGALETRIHPLDEMYRFELEAPHRTADAAVIRYFAAGHSIARTVSELAAWRIGGLAAAGRWLDFASGFGRTTRFLVRAIPAARIAVAEIDAGAVRFQAETFGVEGLVGGHDPASLPARGPFDLVLAVSFFSHVSPPRFEAWLARLAALLTPGGMLVFSTHGARLLPAGARLPPSGIAFEPRSETERLPGEEYGTTWVSPEFIGGAAASAAPDGRLLFFPDGLCGAQDLYVLTRPPLSPGLPRLARDPMGALEWAEVGNGRVRARGWAQGDADERPPDVRVVAGEVLAASPGEGPSGARREWRFEFPIDGIPPDRVIRIEAVSARGVSRLLVTETLEPYL
jgi:SAM-dependent methyltransferase